MITILSEIKKENIILTHHTRIRFTENEKVNLDLLAKHVAMTMGSSSNLREIKSKVRIADKGVVIENGTVDGSDLRIPWDQIVSVQRKYYAVYLILSGNQQIENMFLWNDFYW